LDKWPNITDLSVPPKEPKKDCNNHIKEPSRIWRRKQDKLNVEECSIALKSKEEEVICTLTMVVQSI
jgi:hypothetical protein